MNRQDRLKVASGVISLFNRKYRTNVPEKEAELSLGNKEAKHKFDLYEAGEVIGGVTTSTWKCNTPKRSNNSGGQDRVAAELMWLTLWQGNERRVMILTDDDMAKRLYERWKGCPFPKKIEIIYCNLPEKKFQVIGEL